MSDKAGALRVRAEGQVRSAGPTAGLPPGADADAILHELRVHQVELEMQNDELLRTQLVLEAARVRYFELYDLAPVGYLTLGEAGLVTEANLTVAALLGVGRDALVNQPFTRFLHPIDQDVYHLHRRNWVRSGERQTFDVRMRTSDGTPFWAELVATVAAGADGAKVERVIVTDVSDRKRLELAMVDKHAELEAARRVAQEASVAKSEFLSRMSHELRTPLNAVLGFAQLMDSASPPPTPGQRESLGHIVRSGWFLLKLIEEILDLSSIESGKLTLTLEPVPLAEVILDCEAMMAPEARAAGIPLGSRLPVGPVAVLADRSRLKQILLNLLSNAIKYTPRGGTVEISWGQPSVGRVRVSVRDTGEGLSAEQLAHLFEPFNRLGQESGERPGTGIGLVVSRRLAVAMGGEVGVQSAVGAGSVFWVELGQA